MMVAKNQLPRLEISTYAPNATVTQVADEPALQQPPPETPSVFSSSFRSSGVTEHKKAAQPSLAGRCCSLLFSVTGGGPTDAGSVAGFVGRWRGVVVPRCTRMSSGTTGGRRWALFWLIRSLMPLRTAQGAGGRWSAVTGTVLCASPGPSLWPTVTAFRAGQACRAGKREKLFPQW